MSLFSCFFLSFLPRHFFLICYACSPRSATIACYSYRIVIIVDAPVDHATSPLIGIPPHTSGIAFICSPTFEQMNNFLAESENLNNYAFMQLGSKNVSQKPCLSPILGSFDCADATHELTEKIFTTKKDLNTHSTNELPLTELNLDLFTTESDMFLHKDSITSSTNELPLSDIKFKQIENSGDKRQNFPIRSYSDPNILDLNTVGELEEEENTSRKDRSGSKVFDLNDQSPEVTPYFPPIDSPCFPITQETLAISLPSPHRSFSQPSHLSPVESACFPFSFFPHEPSSKKHAMSHAPPSRSTSHPAELSASVCAAPPTDLETLLSNATPNERLPARSLSHPNSRVPAPTPYPPPVLTNPSAVNPESASASAKRHRHSISGQMSYIKMLGFGFGGPLGLKKLAGGSSNSLFSTAVISGSSSAPNLRDMIPSTASASGKFYTSIIYFNHIHIIIYCAVSTPRIYKTRNSMFYLYGSSASKMHFD